MIRRSLRGLVGGWLLFAPAALVAVPAPQLAPAKSALAVQVSPWVLPLGPLAVTVLQNGVLSGHHLAVQIFVDTDMVAVVKTSPDRTSTSISVLNIAPGRHVLRARSGRETAEGEFRVIPWTWIAGGVALGLAALAAGLWRWRSLRPGRGPARR